MLFFIPKAEHRVLRTERPVIKLRRHWIVTVVPLLESIAALLVLALLLWISPQNGSTWLLDSLAWYAMVAVIVRLCWKLAHWWDNVLVVTDERFMLIRGVITSRADMMPVKKLTDMTFDRSTWGLIFGWGEIRIESAGHASLQRFRFVPYPEAVFEAIAKLVFSKELPPPKRGPKAVGRRRGATVEDISAVWPVKD